MKNIMTHKIVYKNFYSINSLIWTQAEAYKFIVE